MSSLDDSKRKIEELERNLDNVIRENIEQKKDIEHLVSENKSLHNELESLKNNLFGMGTIIGVAGLIITLAGFLIASISDLNTKVTTIQAKLDDKITKVDNTIENISSKVQSKSQQVDELNSRLDKLTGKENKSILSTTKGWSPYNGLKVTNDEENQGVIFNGEVTTEGAGYSKESSVEFKNYGGKILSLKVQNSDESTFDGQKMFKLAVNNQPLTPQEKSRINVGDGNYINSGDGTVNFQLPSNVNKVEFVFYNADVKNLKISATIR